MSRAAEELRRLLAALHETEISADEDGRLAAALSSLRADIDGDPRLRWYEGGAVTDNYARFALFHGSDNPLAVPMLITQEDLANGHAGLAGAVTIGRRYEGPPRAVHGGYLSGLFDDILGGVLRVVGGPSGVTGRLTVRYRSLTPLDTPLRFEAWPVDVRSKRVVAKATCRANGIVTAEAEALFVRVDLGELAERTARR